MKTHLKQLLYNSVGQIFLDILLMDCGPCKLYSGLFFSPLCFKECRI